MISRNKLNFQNSPINFDHHQNYWTIFPSKINFSKKYIELCGFEQKSVFFSSYDSFSAFPFLPYLSEEDYIYFKDNVFLDSPSNPFEFIQFDKEQNRLLNEMLDRHNMIIETSGKDLKWAKTLCNYINVVDFEDDRFHQDKEIHIQIFCNDSMIKFWSGIFIKYLKYHRLEYNHGSKHSQINYGDGEHTIKIHFNNSRIDNPHIKYVDMKGLTKVDKRWFEIDQTMVKIMSSEDGLIKDFKSFHDTLYWLSYELDEPTPFLINLFKALDLVNLNHNEPVYKVNDYLKICLEHFTIQMEEHLTYPQDDEDLILDVLLIMNPSELSFLRKSKFRFVFDYYYREGMEEIRRSVVSNKDYEFLEINFNSMKNMYKKLNNYLASFPINKRKELYKKFLKLASYKLPYKITSLRN